MESGSLALEDSEPVGRGLQPPLATGGTTRFPSTGGQHQPRPRSANTSPASERGRERQLDLGNLPTEMSVEGVVDGDLSSGGSSAKDPAKPVALPGGVSRNTDCDAVLSTGMRTSSSGPSVALSASRALQHRHQQHEQGSPCRTGGCGTACCPGRGHDHQGTPDAEAPVHIPPLAPRLPAPPSPRASAEEIPLSTLRMTPRLPQSMFAMPSPPPSRGAAPLRLELRPHRPPPSAVDGVWEKIPHDILSRVVAFTDAHGFRKIRLVCPDWCKTFGECFTNLRPKVLVLPRLARSFPMATCLVLSNTVPGQPQKPSETHYQKAAEVESPRLAPLAAMTALQHLDLSTTPALLFFGLGIKVTAQDMLALASLPNLRSLNLNGQCYGPPWSLDNLRGFTTLTELSIAGECSLTPSDLRALGMLTNLKRLDLGERRFEAGASLSQLSTLRDLRALCLAKCYFMEGGAMQVAGLANLPSLTALDISCWCGVNEAVCAAVTCISSLVHLNVSGTAVTDEGLEELVGMRHLRSLDASYCMEVRGYSLARDLNPTSSLTILNLCECKKVSDARLRFSLRHSPASMDGQQAALQPPWAARFPALAGSRLCAVSLRGCHQLARTHLHRLAEHTSLVQLALPVPLPFQSESDGLAFLSRLRNLQELHMDGVSDTTVLSPGIFGALGALTSLRLTTCRANGLFPGLGHLTSLRSLIIDSCPTFTAATLEGLKLCPSLRLLHLNSSGTAWSRLTSNALEGMTPVLARLQDLKLGGCTNLTARSALIIANTCTSLISLALFAAPKLKDESVAHFSRLPSLTHLDLGSCQQVGDKACASLASFPALKSLDLCGCTSITDEGAKDLGTSSSLRRITLHGCLGISSSVLKALPRWIYVRC